MSGEKHEENSAKKEKYDVFGVVVCIETESSTLNRFDVSFT